MNKSLIKRIINGLGANAYGQAASIIIQIISLPVFLHAWGVDLYGEWLVLFAVPSYFGLCNMGFSNVAGNEITMLAGRHELRKGLSVFQSAWAFITVFSLGLLVLVFLAVNLLPVERWFQFHLLSHQEVARVLLILCIYMAVILQGNLVHAGYCGALKYARSIFLLNTIRLTEVLSACVIVYCGGSPAQTALGYALIRLTGIAGMYIHMRRICPYLYFGFSAMRFSEIRRMFRPAVAFMIAPVSTSLSLQGMVMVISASIGPAATVMFSTMRTLSRFPLQISNAINNTVAPEISMAYGGGNTVLTHKLHIRVIQTAVLFSACATLFLAVFSPWLLHIWSHGKLTFQPWVGYPLLAVAFLNTFWSAAAILLYATNRHQRMVLTLLGATIMGLILAAMLMPDFGLPGAAMALILPELIMIGFILYVCPGLLQDSTSHYLKKLFSIATLD